MNSDSALFLEEIISLADYILCIAMTACKLIHRMLLHPPLIAVLFAISIFQASVIMMLKVVKLEGYTAKIPRHKSGKLAGGCIIYPCKWGEGWEGGGGREHPLIFSWESYFCLIMFSLTSCETSAETRAFAKGTVLGKKGFLKMWNPLSISRLNIWCNKTSSLPFSDLSSFYMDVSNVNSFLTFVRHVTGNDQDYLGESPECLVRYLLLL